MVSERLKKICDVTLTSGTALQELYKTRRELHGAFRGCSEVIHKETGVHFAMRVLSNEDLSHERKQSELHASVTAQRKLNDTLDADEMKFATLCRLYEVLGTKNHIVLINELAPTGGNVCTDLHSLIERAGRLDERDARQIFARLVLATKRAHDNGVMLRNIKPEAIQVRQPDAGGTWEVHIADLHCATLVADEDEGSISGLHGTPEFCAPEVVLWYWQECEPCLLPEPPPRYGLKADVWSLGMCLHVMLCGCFPFEQSGETDQMLRDINAASFSFSDPGWARFSDEALDMVRLLLQRDPFDRPCAEEVLQHPFCEQAVQEAVNACGGRLRSVDFDQALAALEDDDD
mmetsp:Transcript_1617/g.2636  ORF Transcript_1617/g.2636 Transcript_1617/m.2636 type:complete len:347 (+) Transcript_1617:63-1103(+)|eukprot:CAMPEP_0119316516 /NCGR_PEP_ID=MMETSP1333-20130426/39854_1 /TAXON_ID=418940 /ORGANISM="Scyphosphaera apsteinii, Strain RCC1455" /LENGTH=346 /DNA_ID=CAMNT_0007322179 /DNA_START=63 /DNA_END=1103 /DNA_ORIENTATION=+